MSTEPDHLLRDAVAAELSHLTAAGGSASPNSDRATHQIYRRDASRALLHKQLIDDYLDQPITGHGAATAVITAGPAGAGKSTAVQAVLGPEANRYRRLDADIVKDALLTHAIGARLFDDLLNTTLSDGRAIAVAVAGFLRTPQPDLFHGRPMTPVEWLRDGGNVAQAVTAAATIDWYTA